MWRFGGPRLLLAGTVAASVVVAGGARAATTQPSFATADGLRVLGAQRLDSRSYDLRVWSADIGRPLHVRILLPAGYAHRPRQRYPVLYLFHGTSGRASDWDVKGDAESTTARYDVITVMPDCGLDGDGGFWFTDWIDRATSHGPSQFESFLVDQLVPWVDANLRTVAARRGRAVAGLSQGGYGAAVLAARHPDMFSVMATFSGADEIDRDPEVVASTTAAIEGLVVDLDHVPPGSVFGPRATDEVNWQGHDPATLVGNLRGMRIYLWSGAGAPGAYDGTPSPEATGVEAGVHYLTLKLHEHLLDAGIAHYYDDYTYGTHSWPYWARDLRAFMTPMMASFAHPTSPTSVSYESIDRRWTQWGWSVSLVRPQRLAFSAIRDANRHGFTLSGNGTASVVTPPGSRPHERLWVRVSTGRDVHRTYLRRADGSGRLRLTLALSSGADVVRTGEVSVVVSASRPGA